MSDETEAPLPRITTSTDILLRHVIEQWTNADETPKSVAFKPTPKDESNLSTDYDIEPSDAFRNYTKRVGHAPKGTWGLGVSEVLACHDDVEIIKDGGTGGLPESHASIAFPTAAASSSALRKVHERIAKDLKAAAILRTRLHPPASAT